MPVPTKAKNWMLRSELRNAHTSAEGDISEQQNNQESDEECASMNESATEANKDALGSGL